MGHFTIVPPKWGRSRRGARSPRKGADKHVPESRPAHTDCSFYIIPEHSARSVASLQVLTKQNYGKYKSQKLDQDIEPRTAKYPQRKPPESAAAPREGSAELGGGRDQPRLVCHGGGGGNNKVTDPDGTCTHTVGTPRRKGLCPLTYPHPTNIHTDACTPPRVAQLFAVGVNTLSPAHTLSCRGSRMHPSRNGWWGLWLPAPPLRTEPSG